MCARRRTPLDTHVVEPHQCSMDLRLRLLSGVPFFAGLAPEAVSEINQAFREQGYAPGETIYAAGAPAARLHIVADGKVKLLRHTLGGQDIWLDVLVRGDFFGSLSTLGDDHYPDTAQAQTACCVLTISAAAFQAILNRHPSVALTALKIVAARLRSAHAAIQQLSAGSAEGRLAAALLKLAEKLGEPRGREVLIQMPLSRQDLAAMTGTTPETASRVMSQFRQAGLIRAGRQWVAVADRARLAALAGSP